MMSLRAVARSAPRTLTRLSSTAARQTRVTQPSSLSRTAWAPLRTPQLVATFSSSSQRKAAEVDQDLVAKLDSELRFEDGIKETEQSPASIKDFLENTPFKLKDEPGKHHVYLVRKFGNETITVSFSVRDLSNYDPDAFDDDGALADEELDNPPERKQLAETEADEDFLDDAESDMPVPCHLNIVVEKPNKGALSIEAISQDGTIVIENFYYYKDAKMAHSSSPEAVHDADDVYAGPIFASLDEDLQVQMERYLEERGIGHAMAIFVPDYVDVKEQREYNAWLKNIKDFVQA